VLAVLAELAEKLAPSKWMNELGLTPGARQMEGAGWRIANEAPRLRNRSLPS
jgi:hypothetical protein